MSNKKVGKRFSFFLGLLSCISFFCDAQQNTDSKIDILRIDSLLTKSINYKYSNPQVGYEIAAQALNLANDIKYNLGIAESYRAIGIAYNNLNKRDSAINYFQKALKQYKDANHPEGIAKTYNNLGNSYGQYDDKKALVYYKNSIEISTKNGYKSLIAATNLNIGVLYFRMKEYHNSIYYYYKAMPVFADLKDKGGIVFSYQNIGVSQYYLNLYKESEENLLKAYDLAKEENLTNTVSSINLTLARLKMATQQFNSAEEHIKEGVELANELYDEKLLYDFALTSYELEKKRGNYQQALAHLEKVHSRDSLYYRENVANILNLNEEQQKNLEKQKEYELKLEKQEKHLILLIFTTIIVALCILVIFLLVRAKKKSDKNNFKLKKLNEEISKQKENLNKINASLEDIITERTKDLINKNQKLSEYSSHLSHQIRGPVTSLKGLVMLAEDNLIDEKECIQQVRKCIDDIDNKIMDINIALHDPSRPGLKDPDEEN